MTGSCGGTYGSRRSPTRPGRSTRRWSRSRLTTRIAGPGLDRTRRASKVRNANDANTTQSRKRAAGSDARAAAALIACDFCGAPHSPFERQRIVWNSGPGTELVLADLCSRCAADGRWPAPRPLRRTRPQRHQTQPSQAGSSLPRDAGGEARTRPRVSAGSPGSLRPRHPDQLPQMTGSPRPFGIGTTSITRNVSLQARLS